MRQHRATSSSAPGEPARRPDGLRRARWAAWACPSEGQGLPGHLRRLLGYLRPAALAAAGRSSLLAVLSTVFSIVGPKILGQATTKLFEGCMAKLQGVPGAAIDFAYIGQHPAASWSCST